VWTRADRQRALQKYCLYPTQLAKTWFQQESAAAGASALSAVFGRLCKLIGAIC
jgi:hypothetical protein